MFWHARITLLNVQANLVVSRELLINLFASSMIISSMVKKDQKFGKLSCMTCCSKLTYGGAVIKRWGLGISCGYYKCGPRLLSSENRRKIEPKEIPSCFIPCLLVVFTQQLEILVTSLIWSDLNCHKMLNFQHLVYNFLNFNILVERFSKLEIFLWNISPSAYKPPWL